MFQKHQKKESLNKAFVVLYHAAVAPCALLIMSSNMQHYSSPVTFTENICSAHRVQK